MRARLEWELRAGRDAFIIPLALSRKQPLPKWVDEEPLIEALESFYLRAFWLLSTERAFGDAIGPIPYSAIRTFGRDAGLDAEMLPIFVEVIRHMDGGYLDWQRAEHEKRSKARSKPAAASAEKPSGFMKTRGR